MDGHKLSQRLKAVAQMVPEGARIADIGSDHAYLPVNLLLNQKIDFAVAGEVAIGPKTNAESEVVKQGFQDKIIVRLADGLAAIEATDNIDTVVIAGMGGILISKILDSGPRFETLVLQPNTDEATVREWLEQHDYQIIAEDIVAEDNHTYELIKAIPGKMSLSEHEKQFGPLLSQAKSTVWLDKWHHELHRKEKVLGFLQAATPVHADRIAETKAEIAVIQEVLV